MTRALTTPPPPRTLGDAVLAPGLLSNAVLIAAGAGVTAIAAQVVVPLPLWPVPLTLQTFAVLLVGTALGPFRGALAMALYILLGMLGLPVFAEARSGNPLGLSTGGFLLGFVLAAFTVGWLARRGWGSRFGTTIASFGIGTVIIYAAGLPWLYSALLSFGPQTWGATLGYPSAFAATVGVGLLPFLVTDVLKALIAALIVPALWKNVRGSSESEKPS